jgi:hypothetical protein
VKHVEPQPKTKGKSPPGVSFIRLNLTAATVVGFRRNAYVNFRTIVFAFFF